ncbi:hypothetical protein CAPN001_11760 [Capnocytophaga stomatis]|uniref:DUF3853 family protein n=1 Tax=Capnocytophaga stomatis TaxID=1848904 RepID=UPI00194F68D8|nr:DUF3853 family protein [Capnocytophaga stomatis]GIJ96607.1 hypothetical protein CAPN001_11760 [Capnocytophaga stomatis]
MEATLFNPDTPLWQLTVGDFLELMKDAQKSEEVKRQTTYEYGIAGLARALGVSIATANRVKSSGKLNDAIKQTGRQIIVDVERAKELYYEVKKPTASQR